MRRKYNDGDKYVSSDGIEYTILYFDSDCKRYILDCQHCKEKDPELWYEGSINPLSSEMSKGKVTCGCAEGNKKIKWSTEQYKVKIQRIVEESGYEVIDLPEDKITTRSIIRLYNPVTDNTWNVSVNNFLYTKNKDPLLNGRLPDEDIIANLKREGKIPQNVYLERIPSNTLPESLGQNRYSYWKYICPVCDHDKFSKAGVSNASFNVPYTSLSKGLKPCRCGKGYRYTDAEKVFLVKESCKEHELTFLSFENDNISYVCKYEHSNTKKWNSLTTCNLICRACSHKEPRHNGYYKKRAKEEDFLYVLGFEDDPDIIKVGRTFNIKDRLISINRESGRKSPVVFKVFTGCHKDIYNAEQYLLSETRPYKVDVGWTHEVRSACQKQNILNLIKELEDIEEAMYE